MVFIRVEFQSQFSISFFKIILWHIFIDSQNLVIVFALLYPRSYERYITKPRQNHYQHSVTINRMMFKTAFRAIVDVYNCSSRETHCLTASSCSAVYDFAPSVAASSDISSPALVARCRTPLPAFSPQLLLLPCAFPFSAIESNKPKTASWGEKKRYASVFHTDKSTCKQI